MDPFQKEASDVCGVPPLPIDISEVKGTIFSALSYAELKIAWACSSKFLFVKIYYFDNVINLYVFS